MPSNHPPIVLFGYDSSPFTTKIRLSLQHRQIPYTYITVPSMLPRPILTTNFNLTYRKIPVLAIGHDIYIDTSLILEVIATHPSYPPSHAHPALHPDVHTRTLTRLLSSHYTDRPLFRLTTGLIPQTVWETSFATDRAGLIGHPLDAVKLGRKVPRSLSGLDTHLSILEPLFSSSSSSRWFFNTESPTAADIALFYQLDWGEKISRGEGINNLTGGATPDSISNSNSNSNTTSFVRELVFNHARYPGLAAWFERMQHYFAELNPVETKIQGTDLRAVDEIMQSLNDSRRQTEEEIPMLKTAAKRTNVELDRKIGLSVGRRVSVRPDDTGRDDPTYGTIVALSAEEVVIQPEEIMGCGKSTVDGVRLHFPRVGFVVVPLESHGKAKL